MQTLVGQRLSHHRLVTQIGHGAMGVVYLARDEKLGREVAIKLLPADAQVDRKARRRFGQEARALARLNHPNIASIYEFGSDGGREFLVLEYVAGDDLKEVIGRGPLPEKDVAYWGVQLLSGLAAAHARSVIHRDLKPTNIRVTPEGMLKILDFGIARLLPERRDRVLPGTDADGTSIVGTLPYMAPELFSGAMPDERVDIYAAGLILYEMATGGFPYDRGNDAALYDHILHRPPRPPKEIHPLVSRKLEDVLLRCLEKDPDLRYRSARDLLAEIRRLEGLLQPTLALPREAATGPTGHRHNLHRPLTSFVGRERTIEEIVALVRGDSRLVTLCGLGGSGKTRLALEAAFRLVETFPDGVWFVDLGDLSAGPQVARTAATVLQLREDPGRPLEATLVSHLLDRVALIVLDNCEHLLDACARLVLPVLSACPRVRILATSREPIGLVGEAHFAVSPLRLPDPGRPVRPEEIERVEAVRLFVERAAAVSPGFRLTPASAPAVARICQRLDGIPLAIELAAARASVLTPDALEQRLDEHFFQLLTRERSRTERHRTLRATLEWSHALLADRERMLFRRLSVFAGGASLDAIEAVCGSPELEGLEILEALSGLVNKSLVTVSDEEGEARYEMLQVVRHLGAEKLRATAESRVLHDRHRDWFLQLLERSEPGLHGGNQRVWLDRLEREHGNLRAALEWTLAADEADLALRFVPALDRFWLLRGHLTEGLRWLDTMLGRERGSSVTLRARALEGAGALALAQGEAKRAWTVCEESLGTWRWLRDDAGAVGSLVHLGRSARLRGAVETAWLLHGEALAKAGKLRDPDLLAVVALAAGETAQERGDLAQAARLFEQALRVFLERNDRAMVAAVLLAQGRLAADECSLDRAGTLLTRALSLAREVGDLLAAGQCLVSFGEVARLRGDVGEARSACEESLDHHRRLGNRHGVARSLALRGRIQLDGEEPHRARDSFQEALATQRELEDRRGASASMLGLGDAARSLGHLPEAILRYEEALALERESGHAVSVARAHCGLAQATRLERDFVRATRHAGAAASACRPSRSAAVWTECLRGVAQLAADRDHVPAAARLLAAELAVREATGLALPAWERRDYEWTLRTVRDTLEATVLADAWRQGRAVEPEEVLADALEELG